MTANLLFFFKFYVRTNIFCAWMGVRMGLWGLNPPPPINKLPSLAGRKKKERTHPSHLIHACTLFFFFSLTPIWFGGSRTLPIYSILAKCHYNIVVKFFSSGQKVSGSKTLLALDYGFIIKGKKEKKVKAN